MSIKVWGRVADEQLEDVQAKFPYHLQAALEICGYVEKCELICNGIDTLPLVPGSVQIYYSDLTKDLLVTVGPQSYTKSLVYTLNGPKDEVARNLGDQLRRELRNL